MTPINEKVAAGHVWPAELNENNSRNCKICGVGWHSLRSSYKCVKAFALYDGVPVKIVDKNEKADLELEVTEKMPWDASPDVGNRFWVHGDDEHLKN